MIVLDQSRQSLGTLGEECAAYLFHQSPCYAPSTIFGRHRETIDVTPPSVPSTDHRTNDPSVD
jgi:hypothetical protein